MSLVALAAGRGSRGVTTATLALAATWPTPALVAECDPAGGALAARFGLPLLPGMLSLATAARHGLDAAAVAAHVRALPLGLPALLGPSKAEQAEALGRTWSNVAPVLARLPDADVLADCGRVGPHPPMLALLRHADLVVLVAEPTPDGLEQLKDRAAALAAALPATAAAGVARASRPVVSALLLGERPYPPGEVQAWLAEQHLAVDVIGVLAHDPRAAAMLAGTPGRGNLRRSLLLRSARTVAEQVSGWVHRPDELAAASQRPADASTGTPPAASAVTTQHTVTEPPT